MIDINLEPVRRNINILNDKLYSAVKELEREIEIKAGPKEMSDIDRRWVGRVLAITIDLTISVLNIISKFIRNIERILMQQKSILPN